MTRRPRQLRAKPADTDVELASSPCQINEVDPTYMGLDAPEDRAPEARQRRPGEKTAKSGGGQR